MIHTNVCLGITKKWLEALKTDRFTTHTIDLFLEAFKVILTTNPLAESLRSLAMFITYARHSPRKRQSSPLRPSKTTSILGDATPRRQTLTTASPSLMISDASESAELDRSQIATRVMKFYTSLLCDEKGTATIRKFARTVTNRVSSGSPGLECYGLTQSIQWLLFLLADNEPEIVILAAKILARLMVINGTSYAQKFVGKTSGVVIMQHRIRRWWKVPALWLICFAIFFGHDVASIDIERQFDLYNLLETFTAKDQSHVIYPEILPVLTAMLQAGLRSITRDAFDPDSPPSGKNYSISKVPSQDHHLSAVYRRSPSASLNKELPRLGECHL